MHEVVLWIQPYYVFLLSMLTVCKHLHRTTLEIVALLYLPAGGGEGVVEACEALRVV